MKEFLSVINSRVAGIFAGYLLFSIACLYIAYRYKNKPLSKWKAYRATGINQAGEIILEIEDGR